MAMFQNFYQSGRVRQLNVLNCLCTLLIIWLWAALESNGQPRIIEGLEAHVHEFPYQVLLSANFSGQIVDLCGGSLLNKYWVLTAAHCVVSEPGQMIDERYLILRLGAHYRHSEVKGEVKARVLITFPHPRFNKINYANDIALMKLMAPVQLTKGVIWPISLPSSGAELKVGTNVTLAGWGSSKLIVVDKQKNFYACGKTFPAAPNENIIKDEIRGCGNVAYNQSQFLFFPNALQRTTLSIVGQKQCPYKADLSEFICTVSKTSNGCRGDSGSALARPGKSSGSWVIYGVLSHNGKNCELEKGAMYTKVIANLAWISSHINRTY